MTKIFFIIYLFLSRAIYAYNCHPIIDVKQEQFIIGYGSLISEESKKHTFSDTGPNIPIEVYGYQRSYCVQNHFNKEEPKAVYLGVQKKSDAKLNGVFFKIQPNHIKKFDQREIGYCRFLVPITKIKMLIPQKIASGEYWIYVPQKRFTIKKMQKPYIPKYYKDIYLKGCLAIEKKYRLKNYYKACLTTKTK